MSAATVRRALQAREFASFHHFKGAGAMTAHALNRIEPFDPDANPFADPDAFLARIEREQEIAEAFVCNTLARRPVRAVLVRGADRLSLTPSFNPDYAFRLTSFDKAGPWGHREYNADATGIRHAAQEIAEAVRHGFILERMQ